MNYYQRNDEFEEPAAQRFSKMLDLLRRKPLESGSYGFTNLADFIGVALGLRTVSAAVLAESENSADLVRAARPIGPPPNGPSGVLTIDPTNPVHTLSGDLPEQTATLTLNIGFSGSAVGFGGLILVNTGTVLDGLTVNAVLGLITQALAGIPLPSSYTNGQIEVRKPPA